MKKQNEKIINEINQLEAKGKASVIFLSENDDENYAMAIGGREKTLVEMLYTEMTKNEFFRKVVLQAASFCKEKKRG